jgi:hypothetical protein
MDELFGDGGYDSGGEWLCQQGKCEPCCEMTSCGCAMQRALRQMNGARGDSEGSSSSGEFLWPDKCLECDAIVLGGGLCSECRGSEESDRSSDEGDIAVMAPMVKTCEGSDHSTDCYTCVVCSVRQYDQEFAQCGMCEECVASSLQSPLTVTPQAETEEANTCSGIKKGRNALFVTPRRTIEVCSGTGGACRHWKSAAQNILQQTLLRQQ